MRAPPPTSLRTCSGTLSGFVCHATRNLLDRARPPTLAEPTTASTTLLGSWYATVLFWRPQVGLAVSDATLLPVLWPLAPAATLLDRLPAALAAVLAAHGVDQAVITAEVAQMGTHVYAKTVNRSTLGVLVELSDLADTWRDPPPAPDLVGLALQLATVPCGPPYRRHVSPDHAARVATGRFVDVA